MFRITDVGHLASEGNYVFSIQYRDSDGKPHVRGHEDFYEDIHREVEAIFIISNYTEDGMPQIAFVVRMNDEDIHYEPELIIPITLLDFVEHMETNSEEDIEINCPEAVDDLDRIVTHFELKADPECKKPPEIIIQTDKTFMQIKIPTSYD